MEGARIWSRSALGAALPKAVWDNLEKIPKHDIKVEDANPTTHPERNPLQAEHHSMEEVEAIATHLKRSLENVVVEIFTRARQAATPDGVADLEREDTLKVRWVEAYFPFTSPSWELEIFWQGDWLEVLGCGVVKQELLISAGVPQQVGWAFGIGLERIAMLLFQIPDIRLFWSQDPRFLSQFSSDSSQNITRFVSFSKHPACYKDVAFWLRSTSSAGGATRVNARDFHENDFMEAVRGVAGDVVEDVRLTDEFTHPVTGRKSLCYRINYRSLDRTLTNMEANKLHDELRRRLVEELGVELR